MTSNHQIFHEINTSFETNVRMGNGALVQAKGKDNIAVHSKMGSRFISDMLLVSDLKQNLLNVGQLVQNGYAVHFEKNGCKIIDRHGQVLANIGMEDNTIFALQMKCKMSEHNMFDERPQESDKVIEQDLETKEEENDERQTTTAQQRMKQ
jgi:hypothetical protein